MPVQTGKARAASAILALILSLALAVVGGVVPAYGVVLHSVSGHVYLGTSAVSAGAGEVVVHWNKSGYEYNAANQVLTDESGNYTIPNLSGSYKVVFVYAGTGDFGNIAYPQSNPAYDFGGVNVGNADLVNIDATLAPKASISGTVTLASGVTAGSGEVEVSYVAITDHGPRSYVPIRPGVFTDQDGHYETPPLGAGDYRLFFTYLGTGDFQSAFYPGNTRSWTSTAPSGFSAGVPLTGKNVTLPAGSAVSGTVHLGDGSIAAGAGQVRVSVSYWEPTPTGSSSWHAGPTTTTDAAGGYSLTHLLLGQYRLEFRLTSGYAYTKVTTDPLQFWAGTPPTVHDQVMPAQTPNHISGKVRKSNLSPLGGVHVLAEFADPETGEFVETFATTTASDGTYSFNSLPDGTYSVYFEANGYASQAWNGTSYYYQPDEIVLHYGNTVPDVNATMRLAGAIAGKVSGPGLTTAELATGNVFGVLYAWDDVADDWFETGEEVVVSANGTYRLGGLFPDEYVFVLFYVGPRGVAYKVTYVPLSEGATVAVNASLVPQLPIAPGLIVRRTATGALYLVDGTDRLVPVGAIGVAADAGFGTSPRTVTEDEFAEFSQIEAQPLSDVLDCAGERYLASGGLLVSPGATNSSVLDGLPATQLAESTCDTLTISTAEVEGELVLAPSTGGNAYTVDAGVRHKIVGPTYPSAVGAAAWPNTVWPVSASFITRLPSGEAELLPGALLKVVGTSTVLLVDGPDRVVPLTNPGVAADLATSSRVTWPVTLTELGDAVQAPPLGNIVACAGTPYLATRGKLWATTAGAIGALPMTALSDASCAALGFSTAPAPTDLMIRSTSGSIVYLIVDGVKHPVHYSGTAKQRSRAAQARLAVNAGFLASIPTGASVSLSTVVRTPIARGLSSAGQRAAMVSP